MAVVVLAVAVLLLLQLFSITVLTHIRVCIAEREEKAGLILLGQVVIS